MARYATSRARTREPVQQFGRVGAQTLLFNGLTLAANLASGIIIARGIGTSGRGELTAITTIAVVGVWLFAMGCIPATSFHVARHPQDAGRLLAAWLMMIIPIGLIGIGVLELVCPALLSAQQPQTVELARLFLLWILPSLLYQVAYGVLLGDHDFLFANAIAFVRFAAISAGYAGLWMTGHLDVTAALLVNVVVDVVLCAVVLRRAVHRHGLAVPDLALARRTLWYGFRAHGTQVGGIVNGRVDLLMLPAFLGAASVGLYSVATNVSWITFSLANALAVIVLPAAARHEVHRTAILVAAMYATLIVGLLLAAVLAIVAEPAVRLVYGPAFVGSTESIRLLLPGTVAYAVAGVLAAGLYALERPGLAAIAQVPGIVITVVGLLLFLKQGGIVAAAGVSSVAYASVLVASLVLYRSAAGIAWSDFIARPAELRRFVRSPPTTAGGKPRQEISEVEP
jgi:antigen flippase